MIAKSSKRKFTITQALTNFNFFKKVITHDKFNGTIARLRAEREKIKISKSLGNCELTF